MLAGGKSILSGGQLSAVPRVTASLPLQITTTNVRRLAVCSAFLRWANPDPFAAAAAVVEGPRGFGAGGLEVALDGRPVDPARLAAAAAAGECEGAGAGAAGPTLLLTANLGGGGGGGGGGGATGDSDPTCAAR